MKKITNLFTLTAIVLFISGCNSSPKSNDTATENNDDHSLSTVFENDYTAVVTVTLEPGEKQKLHAGNERVIYSLNNYTINWEENGEDLGEKKWKKGDVHFHSSSKHKAINTGKETAEWLVFSKKAEAPSPCKNGLEDDITIVRPDITTTLLDNDQFKVVKVTLPAGDSIPKHSGTNRIIYSLSNYSIEYTSDQQDVTLKNFKPNDTHWHNDCFHTLKNTGETSAEMLVVSFK